MNKRLALFVGILACFLLSASSAFALSFNITSYGVGSQPGSVAVGDFNGDGKLDIAVANKGGNTVSILLGNGDGTFKTAMNFGIGTPVSLAVGDFNRDGIPDLGVARGSSNIVSILLGNGDGTFQPAKNISVNNAQAVAVSDFNRDGKPDIAVAKGSSNTVSIFLGNGDGTFQTSASYGTGNNASSVAVGDFDKDGKFDLVVTNFGANTFSILLGNGDGTFQSAMSFAVNSPQSVAVEDLDRDGKPDLAIANSTGNTVSILLGNGDGTFETAVGYGVGTNASAVVIGDFDGDGKPDLAVTDAGSDNVSILLGNGDGTFQTAVNFPVKNIPVSAAAGDFNGDGKLDLVVANSSNNSVSVLINTTSQAGVPGAPTGVTAVAGNQQATVSFTAPSANGSPITSYTVTSSPGKITASGPSSPITVYGLTNGTGYTFTVRATNALGTGPASSPSNKVTPGPIISVSPTSVNFGSLRVGDTSSNKEVTINSKGNVDLFVGSITITGDAYEFTQTNNCSTVPAKESCPIKLTFVPVKPFGKKSAVLTISSNDPKKPGVNVKLSGEAGAPKISVSPESVNFGSTQVGTIAEPKVLKIKNTGVSDLTINSITLTGTDEFIQANSCSIIAKGKWCAVYVTFSPASAGKKKATILISSDDPKKPTTKVNLSGKGQT